MGKKALLTVLFLPLCMLLQGAGTSPDDGFWTIRIGTGLSFSQNQTWTDQEGHPKAVPVYGEGYHSQGERPASLWGLLALGYRMAPTLEVSLEVISQARATFEGQVNYPDAGDKQPVSAPIRTTVVMTSWYWRPLEQGWLTPFVSAGLGLSRNHCSGLEMSFPQLERPHTFAIPRGTKTALAWKVEGGCSFRLGPGLRLESGLMLLSAGRYMTEAGSGTLVREGRTTLIPVQGTRSTRPLLCLFTTGLSWRP